LSSDYFEVVLKRKREKIYKPGDCLLVKKSASDEMTPYFIASGVGEPWIRIIIRANDPSDINQDIWQAGKLRVDPEAFNVFPTLASDNNKPTFICSSVGISPFLSYMSTFPSERINLYVIGEVPNHEWVKSHPQAQVFASVNELEATFEAKMSPIHYICGPTDQAQAMLNMVKRSKIKDKKIKYIDFL
jgi:ferredoxin-NADP reductase